LDARYFKQAIIAVAQYASNVGLERIGAWGTECAILKFKAHLGGRCDSAGFVALPGKDYASGIDQMKLPLWLLGGDTDFR
jgi:hypothetical protein